MDDISFQRSQDSAIRVPTNLLLQHIYITLLRVHLVAAFSAAAFSISKERGKA